MQFSTYIPQFGWGTAEAPDRQTLLAELQAKFPAVKDAILVQTPQPVSRLAQEVRNTPEEDLI